MSLFPDSAELDDLATIDPETLKVPRERLTTPDALRSIYTELKREDEASAQNRMIIQQLMNFTPPHDAAELDEKNQGDRFNITTGEGPALKDEAVGAYMDIAEKPACLLKLPLLSEVGEMGDSWGQIMAEEFTTLRRDDDNYLPKHLEWCDLYVTHGVAIPYFDDSFSIQYQVGGLDSFKFPRKTGIISSKVPITAMGGTIDILDLYAKIEDGTLNGWDENAVKRAIATHASKAKQDDWADFEKVEKAIKANDLYVSTICNPIPVIYGWVREFDGSWSMYLTTETAGDKINNAKETFLYKKRGAYQNVNQAFQLCAFSVGTGGLLYTVRGLGYLIYQLCNSMDILHCQFLDSAVIQSALIVQPASVEDMQDMSLINFGPGIAMPPTMRIPDRPQSADLNRTLVPAIRESRDILNRVTGGLSAGGQVNPDGDRKTKLEVSAKLDFLNKLNSFAVSLFYGPYEKIIREQVRRAYTVRQRDPQAKQAVIEMKQRCIDRGVPEKCFKLIDYKRIKVTRIIGNGSMASRIGLMEQVQPLYQTWDDVGRKNFSYDHCCEVLGYDKADRYVGRPDASREPIDASIAVLENFQLLEGDYIEPRDGQNHMVHIPVHLEELEAGLQGLDEGTVDLKTWTMEHFQLFKHVSATLERTTVHETMQAKLNEYNQRTQQIGEIAMNGMKMINKEARDAAEESQTAQAQGVGPDGQPLAAPAPDPVATAKAEMIKQKMGLDAVAAKQKISQDVETHLVRLKLMKDSGNQAIVLATQKAMTDIALKNAQAEATSRRPAKNS
jgi:hypothetical protein